MKSVADTNVLLRLITQDDPNQLSRIVPLLKDGELVILQTVRLETAWVLRSAFRYSRDRIETALSGVLDLKNVRLADEAISMKAIELYSQGVDFADAFHLVGATGCDEFATFDKDLVRKAAGSRLSVPEMRLL